MTICLAAVIVQLDSLETGRKVVTPHGIETIPPKLKLRLIRQKGRKIDRAVSV